MKQRNVKQVPLGCEYSWERRGMDQLKEGEYV
jgi:hypothetical protein